MYYFFKQKTRLGWKDRRNIRIKGSRKEFLERRAVRDRVYTKILKLDFMIYIVIPSNNKRELKVIGKHLGP